MRARHHSTAPSQTLARSVVARLGLGVTTPLPADFDRSPEALSDLLGGMKIPLLDLDESSHPDLDWLFRSAPFRRVRAEQAARHSAYRSEFESFLAETGKIGVPVIALKACDQFPYESSNLDLLVPIDAMEDAARILDRLGFLRLSHYVEPHKTLHKKFTRGREVAIFHLHHEVSWDGAIFLDRQSIWTERRPLVGLPGAAQMHPAHLAALTIAHAVYENARVAPADLRRVLRALSRDLHAAEKIREAADRHGWLWGLRVGVSSLTALELDLCSTDRVARALGAHPVRGSRPAASLAIELGRMRCRLMLARKILASPESGWSARVHLLGSYLRAKLRVALGVPRHRGLLVAFSGVDGAGKTMYARRIRLFLSACDVENRLLWARGGSTNLLLRLKSMVRRASRGSGPLRPRQEGVALASRWQRMLWPWIVMTELLATYAVLLPIPLLRRRVVLLDRHVLDATVDLAERLGDRDPRTRLAWRLLERLSPRPRAHFLFDVPAEIAMQRKDSGMDRAQMERRRALYLQLAPADVRVIDTVRDPDRVADEVGRQILDAALGGRA